MGMRRHLSIQLGIMAVGVRLLGLVLVGAYVTVSSGEQADNRAMAIARVVEARTLTKDAVLQIKQRFKPHDETYREARRLYTTALSKYDGWIAAMKDAIRLGDSRRLDRDPRYDGIASEASSAARAFVIYVEKATGESKSVDAVLLGLAQAGVAVWRGIRSQTAEERNIGAERFEKDVKWLTWDEIRTP